MPAETELASHETPKAGKASSQYVMLFELEGVAVAARQAEFETVRSLLGEQNLKVTPQHFARHCLNLPPSQYLPILMNVLGAKKASTDRLVSEVQSGVEMFLSSGDAALNPHVKKLLAAARARKIPIGMLSGIKESIAKSLAATWAGEAHEIQIFAYEPANKAHPRADTWLKLAKSLSCTPRQCVVIAGSMFSVKTALSAGMRCIVIPDSFTAFQDFSGADHIIDPGETMTEQEILDSVCPITPFN